MTNGEERAHVVGSGMDHQGRALTSGVEPNECVRYDNAERKARTGPGIEINAVRRNAKRLSGSKRPNQHIVLQRERISGLCEEEDHRLLASEDLRLIGRVRDRR